MIRAQLVFSESGRMHLSAAGVSSGWLCAWLMAAGAERVNILSLEGDGPRQASEWRVYIATVAELMRVALAHGRRIVAADAGGCRIGGVREIALINPQRRAWLYEHEGSRCLLLPIGDIAYQRHVWLPALTEGGSGRPLHVCLGEEGGLALEPGLVAYVERGGMALPSGRMELNDGGYLPEEQLFFSLQHRGWKVRFAESCTGGGMSERLSRLPGASVVLDRGWVTYSNAAKMDMLGVRPSTLAEYGAVSTQVVEAMADAGVDAQSACVAVSGIAGPSGGSPAKPVGTVCIAAALPDGRRRSEQYRFSGSRADIRAKSILHGYALLIQLLASNA